MSGATSANSASARAGSNRGSLQHGVGRELNDDEARSAYTWNDGPGRCRRFFHRGRGGSGLWGEPDAGLRLAGHRFEVVTVRSGPIGEDGGPPLRIGSRHDTPDTHGFSLLLSIAEHLGVRLSTTILGYTGRDWGATCGHPPRDVGGREHRH